MKKVLFICIFCVVGILFFGGFLRLQSSPKQDPSDIEPTNCAQSGERIGAQGTPEQCCQGLIPMSGYGGGYTGECSVAPPGGVSICSACGNNSCETKNGENKCNCPKDCG